MPKSKKPRHDTGHGPGQGNPNGNGNKQKHRKMHSFAKVSNTFSTKDNKSGASKEGTHGRTQKKSRSDSGQGQQQRRWPVVPFARKDRILLIGEGDFSFAWSLVTQHRCRNVLATSYDSEETLYGKYPQTQNHIRDLLGAFQRKSHNTHEKEDDEKEDQGRSSHNNDKASNQQRKQGPSVLFSVDARKLGLPAGGGKEVRIGFPQKERKRPAWQEAEARKRNQGLSKGSNGGPWDVICFNFPHVGGISTDVNRQVRANQELLVAFFKACVPLLSACPEPVDYEEDEWEYSGDNGDGSSDESEVGEDNDGTVRAKRERRTEPGQILVSLFEGEPYTLWNIRDLARHAGLRVVTSFKFPWTCYHGYSHARTLGEIDGKDGGRGGWRGEDRDARMYVFEPKQDGIDAGSRGYPRSSSTGGKRKKGRVETEESESD